MALYCTPRLLPLSANFEEEEFVAAGPPIFRFLEGFRSAIFLSCWLHYLSLFNDNPIPVGGCAESFIAQESWFMGRDKDTHDTSNTGLVSIKLWFLVKSYDFAYRNSLIDLFTENWIRILSYWNSQILTSTSDFPPHNGQNNKSDLSAEINANSLV